MWYFWLIKKLDLRLWIEKKKLPIYLNFPVAIVFPFFPHLEIVITDIIRVIVKCFAEKKKLIKTVG